MQFRNAFIGVAIFLGSVFYIPLSVALVKGIYITQPTAERTRTMQYLIRNAKALGIGTFVIDIYRPSKRYAKNIAMVKQHGIRYVARVVVFPYGGTERQVRSRAYWKKRWRQAKYAISLGADAIQLDYIRYKPTRRASRKNALDIYEVIKFFRQKLRGTRVELQIDVFGIAAHQPSRSIGQNVKLFANMVDVINPMVYPSHYEPFRYHAKRPYQTVFKSIKALKNQLRNHPHIKIHAFIELFNYRYPMSNHKRVKYIQAQIRGVYDADADGWYAWSARNKYGLLFRVLKMKQ